MTNPEELYDTPRAWAQRQKKELNRLGYELLRTINWETYNREEFEEAVKRIYKLGYDAGIRNRQ